LNNEHPITPPPELVQQWYNECPEANEASLPYVATQAARWGADQELLACGEYLERCAAWEEEDVTEMYNYRRPRPKPPSLKERALKILEEEPEADDMKELIVFDTAQVEIIRRALESLPD
jgi:hypothetical protein